jgi:hypothetical protein
LRVSVQEKAPGIVAPDAALGGDNFDRRCGAIAERQKFSALLKMLRTGLLGSLIASCHQAVKQRIVEMIDELKELFTTLPKGASLTWLFITGVVGGFASQFIAFVGRWFAKPRLSFQIGSTVPFVIQGPTDKSPTGSTWIRVRVDNKGWRNAESCRVYLTDVFKEGKKEPILNQDAMMLQASAGGDGDAYKPITISRKFGRFWDIAETRGRDELYVASKEFWHRNTTQAPLPTGTYDFWIAASGTNFNPAPVGIKIRFAGASAPICVSSYRIGGGRATRAQP